MRNTGGPAHDRPAHRDALALAAGELAGLAVRATPRARASGPLRSPARRSRRLRRALQLQREADVLGARSCAGTARSSGTPSRCRGPSGGRRSRRGRRSTACPTRSSRARRPCAAPSTCRNRTARRARGTRRPRHRASRSWTAWKPFSYTLLTFSRRQVGHVSALLAFDGAREEAPDEVALQREEDDERHDDRDERGRRQQLGALASRGHEVDELDRSADWRSGSATGRSAPPGSRSRPTGTGRWRTRRAPAC